MVVTEGKAEDVNINIPDFIELVGSQIREAMDRFESTEKDPLLILNELQLQIAFTAEKSDAKQGGVTLRPYIFSVRGEITKEQKDQVVHTVTLNLSAVSKAPTAKEIPSADEDVRSPESPSTESSSKAVGDEAFTSGGRLSTTAGILAQSPVLVGGHRALLSPTVFIHGVPISTEEVLTEDSPFPEIINGEMPLEQVIPDDTMRAAVSQAIEQHRSAVSQGDYPRAFRALGTAEVIYRNLP